MNEPGDPKINSGNSSGPSKDRQAIPMGQQPVGATTWGESSLSGEKPPEALEPSSVQAEGLIPKAAEAAEKAAEKGLEKTSSVVGGAIDKVADAAISALGGTPKTDRQQ